MSQRKMKGYGMRIPTIFGMGGTFDPKTGRKRLIGRTKTDGPEYQAQSGPINTAIMKFTI